MRGSTVNKKWPIVMSVFILLFAMFWFINLQDLHPDISGYAFLQVLASLMPLVGYIGLFALLLIENTPVPFPGMLFLPLAGYYVFVGSMSFTGVLAVSLAASLVGSFIVYTLALKLGAPTVYWGAAKLGISQGILAKSEVRLCGKLRISNTRALAFYTDIWVGDYASSRSYQNESIAFCPPVTDWLAGLGCSVPVLGLLGGIDTET